MESVANPQGIVESKQFTNRNINPAVLNSRNLTIGLTASAFYAFSSSPMVFEATSRMGLNEKQSVSWYTGIFLTSAIASLILSWRYRMPLPVGWSLPALIFLTSAAANHSHGQLVGGVILAGLAIIVVGATGAAERVVELVPYPVAMGVLAGTVFGYVAGVFDQMSHQPIIVGAAAAGYFGAIALKRSWLPSMAGALVAGVTATAMLGELHPGRGDVAWPQFSPVTPSFDLVTTLGISIPLVLMAIGMGNLQGFAVLRGEGFEPPIRRTTVVMGMTTLVNAAFGGHVSSLQSNGTAIMATAEAGPKQFRFVSTLFASAFALFLAIAAGSVAAFIGMVPAALMTSLAGLAVLPALADAMRKAVASEFPMSGFVAMMIASSSFTLFGLGAALWAFVGGIGLALFLEGDALKRHLSSTRPVATLSPVEELMSNC